jgi:hypothetical protein
VTPRRETARAIPLEKSNIGAGIAACRSSPRDEMKARMPPRVTGRTHGRHGLLHRDNRYDP